MAVCHSSVIGETKTYSLGFRVGVLGEFRGVFCFRFEVNLKFLFIEQIGEWVPWVPRGIPTLKRLKKYVIFDGI